MEQDIPKLYVLTGGPGAGKTTLLNELKKNGFITVPEEGRRIIQEQIESHGDGLPWMDKKKFADLMFNASVDAFQKINQTPNRNTIFFDRGILDTIGYLKLEKIPVPREMEITAREMMYHKNVFILPPWQEIYENDIERKQTLEVAIATFECMNEIYQEYGYHTIEIPKVTVAERLRFILDVIQKKP